MEDKKCEHACENTNCNWCENKNKCGGANCGSSCYHGKRHFMLKVFMLLVMVLIFALGTEIGELKGELRATRGEYYGCGMMRGFGLGGPNFDWNKGAKDTTPSTKTETPAPKQ